MTIMNDKELANAAFELLETNLWDWDEHMNTWCEIHGEEAYCSIFVRDWRVAGALMEKWGNGIEYALIVDKWEASYMYEESSFKQNIVILNESLPRAIIETCVEALND